MNIILIGPPGAGKGTQSKVICEHLGLIAISTGNMLRAAIASKSKLGLEAKVCMDKGELVPDQIIIDMVYTVISGGDSNQGYLLDGFPRTDAQALALAANNIKIDKVIEISAPDAAIVSRISGRMVHLESGRTYHKVFNAPKISGKDDVTGDDLIQREDDKEEVIRDRLTFYHRQTSPLLSYYKNIASSSSLQYYCIDGSASISVVNKSILSCLV
jgi:adenylate kinase